MRPKTHSVCRRCNDFVNKFILDCYYISRFSTMQIAKLMGLSEAEVWNEIGRNGDKYRKRSQSEIRRSQ